MIFSSSTTTLVAVVEKDAFADRGPTSGDLVPGVPPRSARDKRHGRRSTGPITGWGVLRQVQVPYYRPASSRATMGP
jgi:hypothetical protein